jgi:hypothetical protein
VGSGRFIFSLNYTDADFDAVCDKIVTAAQAMQRDRWWWRSPALTDKSIRRQVLREMIAQLTGFPRDAVMTKRAAYTPPPPSDRSVHPSTDTAAPGDTA